MYSTLKDYHFCNVCLLMLEVVAVIFLMRDRQCSFITNKTEVRAML